MNESEINNRVNQLMSEFENIEKISVASEWSHSLLMKKISNKRHLAKNRSSKLIYLMLIIFIANVGIVFKIGKTKPIQISKQESKFKTISKELLVNPISINN
ncbi:MAG: hypothetical protein WCO54_00775 [Bacteroidota bacterium]